MHGPYLLNGKHLRQRPPLKKRKREITSYILEIWLRFLHSALPLIALYQCTKFHSFTFNTFVDMLRTNFDGRTDKQTDGRTDKVATIYSPFVEHRNLQTPKILIRPPPPKKKGLTYVAQKYESPLLP